MYYLLRAILVIPGTGDRRPKRLKDPLMLTCFVGVGLVLKGTQIYQNFDLILSSKIRTNVIPNDFSMMYGIVKIIVLKSHKNQVYIF